MASSLQVLFYRLRRGGNDFLPEESHFISRFKEGGHENQSVRARHIGNMKKPLDEEKEFLKRA